MGLRPLHGMSGVSNESIRNNMSSGFRQDEGFLGFCGIMNEYMNQRVKWVVTLRGLHDRLFTPKTKFVREGGTPIILTTLHRVGWGTRGNKSIACLVRESCKRGTKKVIHITYHGLRRGTKVIRPCMHSGARVRRERVKTKI